MQIIPTTRNARLLHYSHCVSDVECSRRFSTDVLGFEICAELNFDDADTAKVMGVPAPDSKASF